MRIGLFLLMALFSVTALSAGTGQWHRIESPHFVFYSDQDPDEAREKIQEMELFRELALMVTGIQAVEGGPKLEVYLASNLSQFYELSGTDSIQYASVFFSRWGGERASVIRDFGEEDFSRNVLLANYVYEILYSNNSVRYPRWYVTGFAEYLSQVKFKKDMISFGRAADARLDTLRAQSWQDFNVLMNLDHRPDNWLSTFDAQAWLVTHFFMSDESRKKVLLAYLEDYNRHGDASRAYKDHIGKRFVNLHQEMLRYFAKGRYVTGNLKIRGIAEYPTEVVALDEAGVLLAKGRIHMLARDVEKCLSVFNERLSLTGGDFDSTAAIAQCKTYNGDFSGLLDIVSPDDASEMAREWLASAYQDQGVALGRAGEDNKQYVDLVYGEVSKILATNKRSVKAISMAAWVMHERGNYEMAVKLFDTAAIYAPYDRTAPFGKALALAEMGRLDEARAVYKQLQVHGQGRALSPEAKALKKKLYPQVGDEESGVEPE